MANETIAFDGFRLDRTKRKLSKSGSEIKLSDNEYDLLAYLIENRPDICSHDQLIEGIWGETHVSNNSVEKLIVSLRRKLGDNADSPQFIKNRRGRGYSFINHVYEIEDSCFVESEEDIVNVRPHKIGLPHRSNINKTLVSVLLASSVITVVLFLGISFWKARNSSQLFNRRDLLFDDFSDKELDSNRWVVSGKGVKVIDGVAQVFCLETDNCGRMVSEFANFDPNRPVTVESRLKVYASQNLKKHTYFLGFFGLTPKNPNLDDIDTRDKSIFGVYYANYDYESKYPNGEIDEFAAEGWFLFRNGGSPSKKNDYKTGKIGKRISPDWDTWFEQRLVYDRNEGTLSCVINDEPVDTFQAGDLFEGLEENKIRVEIAPRGWWLNHSIEVDYIRIYQ